MAKRSLAKLLSDADRHQTGARVGGDYQKLNRDLLELLGDEFFHLLTFKFHPDYAKVWSNDAVLCVICGSHSYSVPVWQLSQIAPEISQRVKKNMNKFWFAGVVFPADRENGPQSVIFHERFFGFTHIGPFHRDDSKNIWVSKVGQEIDEMSISATQEDVDLLRKAIDLSAESNRTWESALEVDGVVKYLYLERITPYYKWRDGHPIHHTGICPLEHTAEIFKALKAGKSVVSRKLESAERQKLILEWMVPEEDQFDNLLKENMDQEWKDCPLGQEFEYAQTQNCPEILWCNRGVDTILASTRWCLLPPTEDGHLRVTEVSYRRYSENPEPILHMEPLGSVKANQWLTKFAQEHCNPGWGVKFGYFVARMNLMGSAHFSNRVSGNGFLEYGREFGKVS